MQTLAAAALGQSAPSFLPYQLYPVSSQTEAVAIGDVNGDGRNDVLMTTTYAGAPQDQYRLFVFLQTANGKLANPVTYPHLDGSSIAVGDVTGDGRNDVVVASGNSIRVFRQTVNGTLQATKDRLVNHSSLLVGIADFNADKRLDVVSIPWGSNSDDVDLFLQRRNGTLGPDHVYELRHSGYDDLSIGDVTGDGRADLVVTSGQGSLRQNIGVLPQSTTGTFDSPRFYDTGSESLNRANAIGDLDGDGRLDIVVGTEPWHGSSFLGLFKMKAGGFQMSRIEGVIVVGALEIGDLNGDHRNDIVVLHDHSYRVGYLLQGRNGRFRPEVNLELPYGNYPNPHGLAIGDVNSDGLIDIVIANDNEGLLVLRQRR
jgi:hypothetical protein